MKPRIFGLLLLVGVALAGSCSKDPGEITLAISVDSGVTGIENFIFIVSKGSKKILYPADCIGCPGGAASCEEADACLKTSGCGFGATEANFRPKVTFADFAVGETVTIIACGVGAAGTSDVKAAGSTTVENTVGVSGAVTLSGTDFTPCTSNLNSNLCL